MLCLLTHSVSNAYASRCPKKFPKALEISKEEMKLLLKRSKTDDSIRFHRTNISSSTNITIPSSSNDAVVVFAVIGLVIIVAWLPYALAYLYDPARGESNYCPWYRLSLRYKDITSSSSKVDAKRSANYTGINLGIASLGEEYSFLGLSMELGSHKITDTIGTNEENFDGTYFMIGPSIALGKPHNTVVTLNLLGGTSFHEDISLMGEASIDFIFNLNDSATKMAPTFNINFGANYLDINEQEGIIKNINQYSLFFGVGAGVNF